MVAPVSHDVAPSIVSSILIYILHPFPLEFAFGIFVMKVCFRRLICRVKGAMDPGEAESAFAVSMVVEVATRDSIHVCFGDGA